MSGNQSILVSFIIPHHGREEMLVETIKSIASQEVTGDSEVLIMSKSDPDDCEKLLSAFSDILPEGQVDIFTIPVDKTISYGRNAGAGRAKGSYLAFIDADVRLAPDWVASMIDVLSHGENVLLAGAVQREDDDRAEIDVIKSNMSQASAGVVNALPGNALFIKKEVFQAHPQFPEHLETCEDWVFTNTLSMLGKVVLTDKSYFVHLGEDKNYLTLFHKEIWRGTSNLGSIRGRKIELAEWPSFMVPVWVAGALIASLVSLLLGHAGLFTVFLLFGLLPPFLYTWRLKIKSGVVVGIPKLVYFYCVYFLARSIGMVKGIFTGETLRESRR